MRSVFHFRNADRSKRMRAVKRLLSRKRGATGAEICKVTGSIRASSDVSELRAWANSTGTFTVSDAVFDHRTDEGCSVFRWWAYVRD